MEHEVTSAILAAVVSLVISGGREVVDRRRQFRQERRDAQVAYLRPLRNACRELWLRLSDVDERVRDKKVTNADFIAFRDSARRKDSDFVAASNDYRTWHGSTLYITARYFACAAIFRSQLPLSAIPSDRNDELEKALDDVRAALGSGGPFGFWPDSQDAIGQAVAANGTVLTYRDFIQRLVEDHVSYTRLFDFYSGIEGKLDHQVKAARPALGELLRHLEAVLNPKKRSGTRASP